jgi:hypothetical protein
MKVNIGAYPTRLICNIYTNYMKKKYGFKWDIDSVTRFDHLVESIENNIQSLYNILNWLWFDRRKQKVKVHINKWDTWSIDSSLAPIIHPMLVQLKATNHGYPANLAEKKWDTIMDEMIWAFGQKCRDDWEGDYYEYRELEPDEATNEMESLFSLKLVWEDREAREAHQKRMTNGFKLFGKYYENLWD